MKLDRVALFVQLVIVGAAGSGRKGTANTTAQSPATNRVQPTEDNKSFVVDLTRDSFNESVGNGSYFIMFYDPT